MAHEDNPNQLVCRPSLGKAFVMILVLAAMAGGCWYVVKAGNPEVRWFMKGLTVFFGLGALAGCASFVMRDAAIIIGPNGIEDRQSRMDVFPWHAIQGLKALSIGTGKLLVVRVANLKHYRTRERPWARWMRTWTAKQAGATPSFASGNSEAHLAKSLLAPLKDLEENDHILNLGTLSPGCDEVIVFLQRMGKQVAGA